MKRLVCGLRETVPPKEAGKGLGVQQGGGLLGPFSGTETGPLRLTAEERAKENALKAEKARAKPKKAAGEGLDPFEWRER